MSLLDWLDNLLHGNPAEFKFAVGLVSACGLVRKDNQDCLLALPDAGFFCVADGMGGGKGGALASQWICETFAQTIRTSDFANQPGERRKTLIDAALQDVNQRIRTYANEHGFRSMGSTVVALATDPSVPAQLSILHAGDSRIYRMRRGELLLLTRDHTVGGELSRKTHSRSESNDLKSRQNPLAHILTRAVGTEFRVRPDWQTTDVRLGDRFLLCTDGVHDMLSDEEIAVRLRGRGAPDEIARRLEEAIVAAGAGDNYSMICLEVRRR
jgi:serine/threonine protein phosphatase PrpC